MFELYAQDKVKGWKSLGVSNDLDELDLEAEKISPKDYYEYLIVEHRTDGDRTVRRQELYQECEVEYSDDVKVSFKVQATTFKMSRMKEKQKLKKEIDEYIK